MLSEARPLAERQIEIWRASLDCATADVERLSSVLSADERQRASRFVFAHDRRRFSVARGMLRHLIAGYVGASPSSITLCYGPFGKPRLEDSTSSLTFNVSHSGERAIFGFARSLEIGVDVEKIDPRVDIEEVARATFAKAEVDALLMLPEAMQRDTFFRVWSRKEAYMKALGVGFSLPPSDFTVSVDPREPPKLLRAADDDSCEAMGWTLSDIVLPEGYAAAFAVPSVSARASILEWGGR